MKYLYRVMKFKIFWLREGRRCYVVYLKLLGPQVFSIKALSLSRCFLQAGYENFQLGLINA
jgi:hypothetical protein